MYSIEVRDRIKQVIKKKKEFRNIELDDIVILRKIDDIQTVYELKVFVVHCGSTVECGHYYSIINVNGNIMALSDSDVRENLEKHVLMHTNFEEQKEIPYFAIYEQYLESTQQIQPTQAIHVGGSDDDVLATDVNLPFIMTNLITILASNESVAAGSLRR